MGNRKRKTDAEEAERHRIAKDLHDSIGQQLSAIKLYLGALKIVPNGAESAQYRALISKSILAVDEAAAELSNICYNLMPVSLNVYGLLFGIEELANKIRISKRIAIDVITSPEFPALDKTLEINIFRIIQEFISNSLKHGKAKQVIIKIEYHKSHKKSGQGKVSIWLTDNGKGCDLNKKGTFSGMGIMNVKSRIDACEGTLSIKSNVGKGTSYEITIPVNNIEKL
ncbi:MAG: sensor histidine kinase [Bacteroidia bacterium]